MFKDFLNFFKGVVFLNKTVAFFNKKVFFRLRYLKKCLNLIRNNTKWVYYPYTHDNLSLNSIINFSSTKKKKSSKNNLPEDYCFHITKYKPWFLLFFDLHRNFTFKKKNQFQKIFCFKSNECFSICKFKLLKNFHSPLKIRDFQKIAKYTNFRKLNPTLSQVSNNLKEVLPKTRIDLRKIETFSIDPLGSVEIDDLIHYRFLKLEMIHEIGLHIPDIFTIINENKDFFFLLKERYKSQFFVKKKQNLFPKIFSKNFFSLYHSIDRLSFSTIFVFDLNAKVKKIKLIRTVVKNKRCLGEIKISESIHEFINSKIRKTKECFFIKKILLIKNICLKLKSNRIKLKGNMKILTDTKLPDQTKVKFWGNLYEELVILSSVSMAEKVLLSFPNCTELRRLCSLRTCNFSFFLKTSICNSFKIDFSNFKQSLKNLQVVNKKKDKNEIFKNLKKEKLNKNTWGPVYFQYTAPIRRFLDIHNQNLLTKITLE